MKSNATGRMKPDSSSQSSHFYAAQGLTFRPRDLSLLDRAGSHFYVAEYILGISEEEINPTRIYRELPHIESCKDQLTQHLCRKISQDDPESLESLFYDLSSTTFTGTRCILSKWGHCKEGYEYHVVLALIVNTKGIPIYWEVLDGGTPDAKTITWLLDRVRTKLSPAMAIPTLVFDRGMVSTENLAAISVIDYRCALRMVKILSCRLSWKSRPRRAT